MIPPEIAEILKRIARGETTAEDEQVLEKYIEKQHQRLRIYEYGDDDRDEISLVKDLDSV